MWLTYQLIPESPARQFSKEDGRRIGGFVHSQAVLIDTLEGPQTVEKQCDSAMSECQAESLVHWGLLQVTVFSLARCGWGYPSKVDKELSKMQR